MDVELRLEKMRNKRLLAKVIALGSARGGWGVGLGRRRVQRSCHMSNADSGAVAAHSSFRTPPPP
eukprot:COSAG01_NODE_96_length_26789_cov_36.697089_7_plen_65_part_00